MIDLDRLSAVCGYCSLAIWIVAMLPQAILNFRRRSASGLAPALLLLWITSDSAGLVGTFLQDQLISQRLIACWHWLVDGVLTLQWLWYRRADQQRIAIEDKREAEIRREEQSKRRRRLSIDQALALHDDGFTPMHVSRQRPSFSGPRGLLVPPLLARTKSERNIEQRRGRRTKAYIAAAGVVLVFAIVLVIIATRTRLLERTLPHGKGKRARLAGRLAAWLMTTLYLTSRFPQLWHNYKHKDVQGLSVSLFILALCANAFYVTSILTSRHSRTKQGGWDGKYIARAMPYLVTAIGASFLDTLILLQWRIYYGFEQPDPRNRLEPGLARREAILAYSDAVIEESAEVSRAGSISYAPDETSALLSPERQPRTYT